MICVDLGEDWKPPQEAGCRLGCKSVPSPPPGGNKTIPARLNASLNVSLCSITPSDSGRVGEVCEESHRALQRRPGPAEPDGLHPERGARTQTLHPTTRDPPDQSLALLFKATEQEAAEAPPAYVIFGLADSFPHDVLNVTSTSCSLWVSPCEFALPSAHAGTRIRVSPVGEAQADRVESSDRVLRSAPAATCSLLSPRLPSLNAAAGTTTRTGPGICTSTARPETPARSAAPFLTPAAPPSPERYLPVCALQRQASKKGSYCW